jgi:hypothetical protein
LYWIKNEFIENKTTGFIMKKILITFIWLIFSNSSFALDGIFSSNQARCSIKYVAVGHDNNGIESYKYVTTQFDLEFNPDGGWVTADPCYKGSKKLAHKMNDWMGKNVNNLILGIPKVNCKRITPGVFSNDWSKYEKCDDIYHQFMVNDWLKYPNQWFNENNKNKKKIIK